ncbi:putative hydrolase/esterase/lipase [Dietzia sp. NCCP-2495]|uniref:alpha/beta hydrolase n=1 Tax=Dietzia sp. NCCP-2495 TaxID=2934675 RepID=UPI00222E3E62|nr:alpha/beta hydrolase [Dietzia sp. NCCP-2495]GLB64570.1 putative hydrolase/esterase/lipase [Dietzia sp. NCCP-2495]
MSAHTSDVVTTYRSPSPTSRVLYWGSRATLRHVYRAWPLTESGIRGLAAVERGFARLPHAPGVVVEASSLGGVPAVTTTPRSGADGSDVTVLYLHGGAFVFCGPGTHARLCSSLAVHLDAPVHAVRYRKLPEVDLAALIDEVYSAYRSLAGQLPAGHRIVVAGDSAGGFLAAKICELAALDDVRAPAAMVGYSPLFDLDREVRDGSWFTRDAYQPAATLQRAQALWSRGPAGIRGERSMLEVDPEAFPPTLITLAAGELVEDSAIALTERLHAAGRTVETHRWYTAVHAFPVLDGLAPESRRARELTVEFLRRTLPRVG